MDDKLIGIVKNTIAAVVGLGGLVLIARYQQQLGSFLSGGVSDLVTLGNGVSNFGSGAGTSVGSLSMPTISA